MLFKRRYVFIILAVSLVLSFAGGYYVTLRYGNEFKKDNPRVAAETTLLPTNTLVNQSTRIIKRYRYTIGTGYQKDEEEKPTSDILGMDKKSIEDYYKKLGYTLVDFTSKEVLVVKEMKLWPPGAIVIKETNGVVGLFDVDENGNLKIRESTDILIEYLPPEDKKEVLEGKICENIKKARVLLEEYAS